MFGPTVLLMLTLTTPPVAQLTGIYRETQIHQPNARYYFTNRPPEVAASFGWKREGVAFWAYVSEQPGTVPIYCETPIANDHGSYRYSSDEVGSVEKLGFRRAYSRSCRDTQIPVECSVGIPGSARFPSPAKWVRARP